MEKPQIIEVFEKKFRMQVKLDQFQGIETDYYTSFLNFLQERKEHCRVFGNIRISTGYNGGLIPRIGDRVEVISVGIEQIDYATKYLKQQQKEETGKTTVETGTARQSSLAFFYMQKAMAFPRKTGNNTKDAEFIRFLTGHNLDTIRKTIGNPSKRSNEKTGKATQDLVKDLTIVLNQFESIQFSKGMELVEKDIETLQNDLESFKEV